jgi:peptide chain release factor 1
MAREMSSLRELVMAYRTYRRLEREAAETEAILQTQPDAEVKALAQEEAAALRRQQQQMLARLEREWSKRHTVSARPVLVEIRAATGGLEASLFVSALYRLYTKFAAKCGLTVEPMHTQRTEAGGFKEIAFSASGPGAWEQFEFERGVHRVQRVPVTEAQGRIHTSTVTVAVLPEPEEVELPPIPAKDLRIDVFRSSGPGGQGVNTTDSAVRIRHLPTGLIVTCQDERSQLRNKEKALRVLRARLVDRLQQDTQARLASDRRRQVGTGERSEKIRTYNFPDRRVTDHRIGLTLHRLDRILEGELQELIEPLRRQAGRPASPPLEGDSPGERGRWPRSGQRGAAPGEGALPS